MATLNDSLCHSCRWLELPIPHAVRTVSVARVKYWSDYDPLYLGNTNSCNYEAGIRHVHDSVGYLEEVNHVEITIPSVGPGHSRDVLYSYLRVGKARTSSPGCGKLEINARLCL